MSASACATDSIIELIDTLWNVNTTIMNEFIKKVSELIDTLWNVNPPPGKKLKHVCQN